MIVPGRRAAVQSGSGAGITFANPIALAMAVGNATANQQNYLPAVNQAAVFSGANPLTLSGVISGNGVFSAVGGLVEAATLTLVAAAFVPRLLVIPSLSRKMVCKFARWSGPMMRLVSH